ncbi:hypothetical protein OS493_036141 [Desmophyllum pertusum]|uniref:Palmitoyltransferase n=1 Tax=Desmophyllum pertusum TaxID=174260 RepID=A0A9W9ZVK7_9CNID|nr:hypothetical protein OS493_036141 [Desmophyllum pertusum]
MAVFDVILNDKISDLKQLLQADPKCANSVGWHGLTPLHQAALKSNQELVDLLLQFGANVNQPNAYGETPLHLACQAASLTFLHKFLEIGAELRAEDSAGRTCIHHAAKSGSVLKLHYLAACGLSLKTRDNKGQTALHTAAEQGQLEACEYLLRHKRFPADIRDSTNATPLHIAAKYAHCEVAWTLESNSTFSMINEPDVTGKTPLDYATEGKTPRHDWLKRHLHYWQASRCPRSRPPNPWMPWFLLLISPSLGLLLIVLSFNLLTTLLATLVMAAVIVFFNVWSFSRHRLQHISAIPSPALFGFFFGTIIQTCLVTLKNLYSDPGVVKSNRISDTGETMTILDVAKGVISECKFCTVCEIVMPEFTKHCRLCEICLLSLDHHCLFLLRCVARNNHRPFVFFMIEVMLANALFVRAAVTYFNLQIFLGEASSFSEAMGHDVYVSVLFIINCLGLFYVFSLTFFQFKIITDGGTTYYSPDGRTLHRTFTDVWRFEGVLWSQRMKIFLQFLLGEYSFYKNMKRKQAQRLV